MKCAIISVSQAGAKLAEKIAASLQADVDLYERKEYASGAEAKYFTRVMALTTDIFTRYDLIIYIMALGITVRAIAPHVQHKTVDPAILGVDELGTFVISVLSGHLGGANDYAREVAEIIDATPVITTATDVHGKVAPDAIARHLQARVEPISALKTINGAIARGEMVDYFVDERMPLAAEIKNILTSFGVAAKPLAELAQTAAVGAVVITDRTDVSPVLSHLYLRPPTLVVGMGCRKDTSQEILADALCQACSQIGRSPLALAGIVSTTVKEHEAGLLALAEQYRRPIAFYPPEALLKVAEQYHLEESSFVKNTIGVGNVCETAAILKTKRSQLLLPKTKFQRTTVAIAEATSLSWESGRDTPRN